MGCQTAIAATIRGGQGHYVLALKANQTTLHADLQVLFVDALAAQRTEMVRDSRTHKNRSLWSRLHCVKFSPRHTTPGCWKTI